MCRANLLNVNIVEAKVCVSIVAVGAVGTAWPLLVAVRASGPPYAAPTAAARAKYGWRPTKKTKSLRRTESTDLAPPDRSRIGATCRHLAGQIGLSLCCLTGSMYASVAQSIDTCFEERRI